MVCMCLGQNGGNIQSFSAGHQSSMTRGSDPKIVIQAFTG
jgi:hypothetical protein